MFDATDMTTLVFEPRTASLDDRTLTESFPLWTCHGPKWAWIAQMCHIRCGTYGDEQSFWESVKEEIERTYGPIHPREVPCLERLCTACDEDNGCWARLRIYFSPVHILCQERARLLTQEIGARDLNFRGYGFCTERLGHFEEIHSVDSLPKRWTLVPWTNEKTAFRNYQPSSLRYLFQPFKTVKELLETALRIPPGDAPSITTAILELCTFYHTTILKWHNAPPGLTPHDIFLEPKLLKFMARLFWSSQLIQRCLKSSKARLEYIETLDKVNAGHFEDQLNLVLAIRQRDLKRWDTTRPREQSAVLAEMEEYLDVDYDHQRSLDEDA